MIYRLDVIYHRFDSIYLPVFCDILQALIQYIYRFAVKYHEV